MANAPIKDITLDKGGFFSRAWVAFFTEQTGTIEVNNVHVTSDGSDHIFIDQSVTVGSSPSFSGLTVDGKDLIKWAVLQG